MNLISAVFDFSFSSFVTTRIIRILYVSQLVAAGLLALGIGFGLALEESLFGLLIIPIIFFILAVMCRVGLEVTIVLFRIAENVQQIAQSRTGGASSRYTSSIDDDL